MKKKNKQFDITGYLTVALILGMIVLPWALKAPMWLSLGLTITWSYLLGRSYGGW